MSLGSQIKYYRMKNNLNQQQLGEMINVNGKSVSGKTISSWEIDRTEPQIGVIEQLCEIFKCQKTDLLGQDKCIDEDIRRIQRARGQMTDQEKDKMMKILAASFEDYFGDNYIDNDR